METSKCEMDASTKHQASLWCAAVVSHCYNICALLDTSTTLYQCCSCVSYTGIEHGTKLVLRPFVIQSDSASRKKALFDWTFFRLESSGPSYRQSGRFYSFCALPRGGWCEEVLLFGYFLMSVHQKRDTNSRRYPTTL